MSEWVEAQKTTFTNWINEQLKGKKVKISDLYNDLEDGVILIKLLETLAPEKRMPGRYYIKPRTAIQKTQNLALVFRFIKDVEKITVVNIGPGDILECNQKLILGLIWSLILRYQIHYALPSPPTAPKPPSESWHKASEDEHVRQKRVSTKKQLLSFLNAILGKKITNFTTDWNDGVILSALVDYCKPGLIKNPATLNRSNGLKNIRTAMTLAEKQLGIPRIISAEDMAAEKPDELSVMTYISYFIGPSSPTRLTLLVWLQYRLPKYSISNFTTDWVDGRAVGALVHAMHWQGFPEHAQMQKDQGLENCRRSMEAAEKLLGVKQAITPEEFANPELNELARMTYLAQFCLTLLKGRRESLLPAVADKVDVGTMFIPNTLDASKPVWMDLNCSEAGIGFVTAEAVGDTTGSPTVEVEELDFEQYRAKFYPTQPDKYTFSVFFGYHHVKGSPFMVNLIPPDADRVDHIDTSVPQETGQPVSLSFDTSNAGRGTLTAKATGELLGTIPVTVHEHEDGTFKVSFKPPHRDVFKVDVNWGKFTAYATGETTGPIPIEVKRDPQHDCHICFNPPQPDVYKVDVNWGGKPVPGSPFTINLLPPAQPEKVECGLPIYTIAGEAVDLPIDITNAGSGQLTAKCFGEHCGEVAIDVVPTTKRIYQVSFVPLKEDRYTLHVWYADTEVKGSPFIINLRSDAPDQEFEAEIQQDSVDLGGEEEESIGEDKFALSFEVSSVSSESETSIDEDHSPKLPKKELTNYIGRPSIIKLRIKGRTENVKLTATATGEKTGTANVEIKKPSGGRTELIFKPSQPDRYVIEVKINKQHIPSSPFIINYLPAISSPSKCRIREVKRIRYVQEVNKTLHFTLDTTEAGLGPLRVEPQGPQEDKGASKLEVSSSGDNPNIHNIAYTPGTPGSHNLKIFWGGEPIPASPVMFIAVDTANVQIFPHGRLIGLDIDFEGRYSDLRAFVIYDRTTTQIKAKVSKAATRGKYKITFQPKVPGLYLVHVFSKDKEIPGSPFPVRHGDPPKPENCLVSGLGGNAYIGETITFTIDANDAGIGELLIRTAGPRQRKDKSEATVTDNQDGTFLVEYTPTLLGEYTFAITWSGKAILNSPFRVFAVERPPEVEPITTHLFLVDHFGTPSQQQRKLEPIPESLTSHLGTALLYRVIINDEEQNGEFIATASGEQAGPTDVTVVRKSDNTCDVIFNPSQPDHYMINMKVNGSEVPNSPLRVDYIEAPPDPSKCVVQLQNIPQQLKLNQNLVFKVDTRLAGPGRLDATIEAPDSNNDAPKVTESEDGIYEVSFTPVTEGTHDLSLRWAGKQIPKSPLTFEAFGTETYTHGKPVALDISAEGKDIETYAIHEDTGSRYKVKFTKLFRGKYRLNFQPKDPGLYSIHVLVNHKEIPSSPYQVQYGKPIQPENCIVKGMPSFCYVGNPVRFTVDAKEAGSGTLVVVATGLSGEKPQVKVTKKRGGIHKVSFFPTAPGYHEIEVTWGGAAVPGHPFHVTVIEPDRSESVDAYLPAVQETVKTVTAQLKEEDTLPQRQVDRKPQTEITIPIGKAFKVQLKIGEREGNVTASVKGKKKSAKISVSKQPDGIYEMYFNPSVPDQYTMDVKLDESHVPISPLLINYILIPPDASKCKILGVEKIHTPIEVDQTISFQVNATEAGLGKLQIKAFSPASNCPRKLQAKPSKEDSQIFDISYCPTAPGLHTLQLLWDNEPIPGSPLDSDVTEPVKPVDLMMDILESFGIEPKPDQVKSEEPVFSAPGEPVYVPFDVSVAGPGVLTAHCSGQQHGSVDVNVSKTSTTNYNVSFIPPREDVYTLSVLYDSVHVKDSPFTIDLRRKEVEEAVVTREVMLETEHKDVPDFVPDESAGPGVPDSVPDESKRIRTKKQEEAPKAPPTSQQDATSSSAASTSGQIISPVTHTTNVIGTALKFVAKVRRDKGEEVTATAKGNKTGSCNVEVTKITDDKFEIFFNPSEPDVYTIEVRLGNKLVPGCPFTIRYMLPPAIPERCLIIEPKILPAIVELNEEVALTIDTKQAGTGSLVVTVEGPSASSVEMKPSEDEPWIFHVSFTPTAPGRHVLNLKWAEQDIPYSPVKFVAVDMTKVETYTHGRAVGLDFDCEYRQGDLKAYAMHEGSRGELKDMKLKIHKVQKGKYKLTFQPRDPGLYYLHVLARQEEIPGSPFVIRYARPAIPSECKVIGLSTRGYVGEALEFSVDATEAGNGELAVHAVGPGGKDKGTITISDTEDGVCTYPVQYIPGVLGKHQVHITWGGKPIPHSPFPLTVHDPRERNIISELFLINRINSANPMEFPSEKAEGEELLLVATTDHSLLVRVRAQTEEQQKAELVATATGESVDSVEAIVSRKSSNEFEILFTPPEADIYTIDAKLGGEQVPGCPFKVRYTVPPPDSSKCKIIGVEDIPALLQVDKEVSVNVDVTLAGEGSLDVRIEGLTGDQTSQKVDVKLIEKYIYRVTYTPTVSGLHHLVILWGGEALPGSPIDLNVRPLQTCPYGWPVVLEINTSGKDLEAHAIHEDIGSRYKVKIRKVLKGKYRLSFEPKEPGLHSVHLLSKRKEIPGSPFHVYYDKPPMPEACIVQWLSNTGYVLEPVTFTVNTVDAGTGELLIRAAGPPKSKVGTLNVQDHNNRTHSAQYIPTVPGVHQFDITWAGKPLPDSPFQINISSRVPEVKTALLPTINVTEVGQMVPIHITNVGLDKDEDFLVARVTGPESGEIDTSIVTKADRSVAIEFTPTAPDDYTFNLKIDDEHVEGSPFLIKVVEKGVLAMDFVHPPGVCHSDVETGKPVNLLIQSKEIESSSELTVSTNSPSGICETSVVDGVSGNFGLTFTPSTPGDYHITVKAKDADIGGSPFKVTAFEKPPDSLKCYIHAEDVIVFEEPHTLGTQVGFTICTADAGFGKLKISAKGPVKPTVKPTLQTKGVYYCTFDAPVAGHYQVEILWNDYHIQGGPFTLIFEQPRLITGLDLEGETFHTSTPYHFKVDCEEVGEGALELVCYPPTAADITATLSVEQQSYNCVLFPKEIGDCEITVKYNGNHIEGSPFNVHFSKPSPNNMTFSLVAEGAETKDVSAHIESATTHQEVPVNLTQLLGGNFNLDFTAVEGQGLEYLVTLRYRIRLKVEEKPVKGSPFKLTYGEISLTGTKTRFNISKIPTEVLLGNPIEFSAKVSADGAGGELTVKAMSDNQEIIPGKVMVGGDGSYQCLIQTASAGRYSIEIFWNGTKIHDIPYAVKVVLPPKPENVKTYGPGLKNGYVGQEGKFTIETDDAGSGKLALHVVGPKGAFQINTDRHPENPRTVLARYNPTLAGKYTISITWSGTHIPGSPFNVVVADSI